MSFTRLDVWIKAVGMKEELVLIRCGVDDMSLRTKTNDILNVTSMFLTRIHMHHDIMYDHPKTLDELN